VLPRPKKSPLHSAFSIDKTKLAAKGVGEAVVGEVGDWVGEEVGQLCATHEATVLPDKAAASSVDSHTVPTNDPAAVLLFAVAATVPLAQKSTDASAAAFWKAPRSTLVNADPNVTDDSLTHDANEPAFSLLTLVPERSIDTSSEHSLKALIPTVVTEVPKLTDTRPSQLKNAPVPIVPTAVPLKSTDTTALHPEYAFCGISFAAQPSAAAA
jgi:hypothetical protein